MRKILFTSLLIFIYACGARSGQIPESKDTISLQLESYKKSFLTGKEGPADTHFNRAKNAIASSNKLNLLAKAYLTKYALHTAVLEDFDATEFIRINKLQPVAANFAYYNFLKGNFSSVENNLLPTQYLSLIKPARNKDLINGLQEISSIDDPLSRLITCGVWVKYLPYNENILQLAINTSADNGWRKPLWAYLTKLQKYYLDRGEIAKAANIKEWLELLKR
ncbi:MAG: hypothetical protein A2W27_03535 [Deltaproteobacteria bacterium RBG_16_44_11]|nr:MAG: hypothetical protein A2W27_03535 [Deltaproteobacteria bacterium RBG_16_44_11]